jgi:hypothetical protein
MDTVKLHKLIKGYKLLDAKIKQRKADLKAELADDEAKLRRAQEALQKVIHRNGEDGLAKVTLPSGECTAYARYEDKYKVRDRDELVDDYILEGVPDKYAEKVRKRLEIFGSTITKDPCVAHRESTGAEEVNGRLVGGGLPPGIGLYTHHDVRIIAGSK